MRTMTERLVFILLMTIVLLLALTCVHAATIDDTAYDSWNARLIGKHLQIDGVDLTEFIIDEEYTAAALKTSGGYHDPDTDSSPGFVLPASLRFIDDEAFAGTAIVRVEIPESVESIGEKAFGDIPTLTSVKIPEHTRHIARMAFAGSDHVTVTGTPNSYARTWARENGIPFTPITVVYAGTGTLQVSAGASSKQEQTDTETICLTDRMKDHLQWRSLDEIMTDRYDVCIAHHISGRAPPACA